MTRTPSRSRSVLKGALDLAVWTAVVPAAYAIRMDIGVFAQVGDVAAYAVAALLLKTVAVAASRNTRRVWHRVGLRDLGPLVTLVAAVTLAEMVLVHTVAHPAVVVPRSVPLIEGMAALIGLAGLRFAARLYYEERGVLRVRLRSAVAERRVLIAGAGESGLMIAREMQRHPESGRRPVGFVDDDAGKVGRSFAGLRVFGSLDDLTRIAARTDADEVLVAMSAAGPATLRRLVDAAREAGVEHRTVPSLHDLASGRVSVAAVREVNVEDLLGRPPVRLDPGSITAYLRGQCVLVTGAGGSIGSEIVRQIAPFGPACIVLLGRGENSVYHVDRELGQTHPEIPRHAVICDVRDAASLRDVFRAFRPSVVFHAAAHKHVPLMEANPAQAVLNNVVGTGNVARLALEFGVRRLVNVSTDKAVNPTNVMGASKRAAEGVVARAAEACAEGCSMVSVRFGNVLGSRGSVVPLFREQIARGGPVVVTHPDMVRYFMTIPEASQLVLQAGALSENGRVYVLDMGEPVRIQDLARDLILLSGLEPGVDIQIEFSGARPGEKLFEELLTAEEGTEPSPHAQIFVARKAPPSVAFEARLAALVAAAERHDAPAIIDAFRTLVPTFSPERAVSGDVPEPAAPEAAAPDVASGDGALAGRPVPAR